MTYNSSFTGAQVDAVVDDVQEAKAASTTDTTAGRLLKVGDFGVGSSLPYYGTEKDLFYNKILRPYGIQCAPDVLYWASPSSDAIQDATIARPGTGTRYNSQGQLETIAANVIRRDYDPVGGFRGALAEPQRENRLIHSENQTLAPGDNDITIDATSTNFPGGTGDTITGSTSGSRIRRDSSVFADGESATVWMIVKHVAGADSLVSIGTNFATGGDPGNTTFDLVDGSVSFGGIVTGEITHLGNGYYLCVAKWVATADTTTQNAVLRIREQTVELVCCQAEVGAYPSSYIKTEATTVTRPADTLTIPQVGDRRRGMIVWQGVPVFDSAVGSGADAILRMPFGRSDTEQAIRIVGTTGLEAISPSAADVQAVTALSTLQDRKSCIAYWWDSDANEFGVSVDGVSAVNSATTFSAPASDAIRIGQTAVNRDASSHTEWAFISYNIPPIAQIEALTGGVL